ncbi:hypothetical protein E2C01_083731 [Portunus trituberculatus]|uniref:Uncharacterized protein n=1 Tax=Portunus trituberculatus TaxID=210409 RepID=A0A5B7IVY0_PORTR|nr:hypothetical protein [Portunus trituberculatus]
MSCMTYSALIPKAEHSRRFQSSNVWLLVTGYLMELVFVMVYLHGDSLGLLYPLHCGHLIVGKRM